MSRKNGIKIGRRKFIRNTGVALAGIPLVTSNVSAVDDTRSMKEAGLQQEYLQHMEQGETDAAISLLESNNVGYTHDSRIHAENGGSGDVSTQDYFNVGNSTVSFNTAKWAPGKRALSLNWDLSTNGGGYPDGPAPPDLGVLAYEEDVFGYVNDTVRHAGNVGPKEGVTSVAEKPVTGDPPNAMTVEYNDNAFIDSTGYGFMQIVVRKQKSAVGRLAGQFAHAWSVSNFSGWGPSSASISVLGFISFSDPIGSDRWVRGGSTDW